MNSIVELGRTCKNHRKSIPYDTLNLIAFYGCYKLCARREFRVFWDRNYYKSDQPNVNPWPMTPRGLISTPFTQPSDQSVRVTYVPCVGVCIPRKFHLGQIMSIFLYKLGACRKHTTYNGDSDTIIIIQHSIHLMMP